MPAWHIIAHVSAETRSILAQAASRTLRIRRARDSGLGCDYTEKHDGNDDFLAHSGSNLMKW